MTPPAAKARVSQRTNARRYDLKRFAVGCDRDGRVSTTRGSGGGSLYPPAVTTTPSNSTASTSANVTAACSWVRLPRGIRSVPPAVAGGSWRLGAGGYREPHTLTQGVHARPARSHPN